MYATECAYIRTILEQPHASVSNESACERASGKKNTLCIFKAIVCVGAILGQFTRVAMQKECKDPACPWKCLPHLRRWTLSFPALPANKRQPTHGISRFQRSANVINNTFILLIASKSFVSYCVNSCLPDLNFVVVTISLSPPPLSSPSVRVS